MHIAMLQVEEQTSHADAESMALRCCPVCDSPERQPHRFSGGDWQVVRCQQCGMTYLANPPRQTQLTDEFAWEETLYAEKSKRREGRGLYFLVSDGLKRIKHAMRRGRRKEVTLVRRIAPRGGRILDIGCANGGTLKPIIENGNWQPFGIEPSPKFAADANAVCEQRGGRVLQTTAKIGLDEFEHDFFDVVMMRSFLEHEVYVQQVLSGVYRTLKPGGKMIIKVPNAGCLNAKLRGGNWPGVRHPDHVNYFRPTDLRCAVIDAGFKTIHFPLSQRLPTSDNMWLVAEKA